MPKIRIVKQYNNLSPKNGITEADTVDVDSPEAAAQFVTSINSNDEIDFDIVDYDLVVHGAGKREILENPTGGKIGLI